MKKRITRALSCLLSLLMIMTCIPLAALPVSSAVEAEDTLLTREIAYSDSNIKYIGRWTPQDGYTSGYWGGAAMEVRFTGSTLKVEFAQSSSVVLYADGQAMVNLGTCSGTVDLSSYLLDSETAHTVKLILSETTANGIHVKKLIVDQDAELLAPQDKLLVEFVGDSITAGAGGASPNAINSYAAQAAELLGVDYTLIAIGGIALVDGWNGGNQGTAAMNQRYFWQKPSAVEGNNGTWDTTTYTPDMVVINLGTNDVDMTLANPPVDPVIFKDEYVEFVQKLRAAYGEETAIVMMIPLQGYLSEQVQEAYTELNDPYVYLVDATTWITSGELADVVHPNATGHANLAARLAPELREILFDAAIDQAKDAKNGVAVEPAALCSVGCGIPSGITMSAEDDCRVWIRASSGTSSNLWVDDLVITGENGKVEQNFDNQTSFEELGWVTSGENTVELDNGTLKMTTSGVYIPFTETEKKVSFKFKMDDTFVDFRGMYVVLYRNENQDVDGFGAAVMPSKNDGWEQQVSMYYSITDANKDYGNYNVVPDTWYTCEMELTAESGLTMKLYPVVDAEATVPQGTLDALNTAIAAAETASASTADVSEAVLALRGAVDTFRAAVSGQETETAVTGVSLDQSAVSLYTNVAAESSVQLQATVQPTNATNKDLVWTTSDFRVATVQNGLVSAVGSGNAVITVTTKDGRYQDTCQVSVALKAVPVSFYEEDFDDAQSLSDLETILFEHEDKVQLDNGTLKLSDPSTALVVPFTSAEKRVYFDFKLEDTLKNDRGLHVRLYNRGDVDVDGLGIAIASQFNPPQRLMAYKPDNSADSVGGYTAVGYDTWYTCVAELADGKLKMKLYPQNGQEPTDWVTLTLPENYLVESGDDYSLKIRVSQNQGQSGSIWVDNLRVTEPGLDRPVPVTSYEENFDDLTNLDDLTGAEILYPNTAGTAALDDGTLKLTYASTALYIPFSTAEKRAQFDFKMDSSFTDSIRGVYFRVYHRGDGSDGDGLGGSIMPTNAAKLQLMAYQEGNPPYPTAVGNADVSVNNWYTCITELSEETLKMKVYPQDGEVPEDWQVTLAVPEDYLRDEGDFGMQIRVSQTDAAAYADSSIWLDNVTVTLPGTEVTPPGGEGGEVTPQPSAGFEEDFDDLADLDDLTGAEIRVEKADKGKAELDNGTLKLTYASTALYIPWTTAEKRVQFDFKMDESFTPTNRGVYFRLYHRGDGSDVDGLGGSIMPPNGQDLQIMIYQESGGNPAAQADAGVAMNAWYTCVTELSDGVLKMKVYPQGGTAPEDWQVTLAVPEGYLRDEGDFGAQIRVSQNQTTDSANYDNSSIWLDNVKVSPIGDNDDAVLDFDSVSSVDELNVSTWGDGTIALDNGTLKLTNAGILVPYDKAEKRAVFDFKLDNTFQSFRGLYFRLYHRDDDEDLDGLGGSIMPNNGANKLALTIHKPDGSFDQINAPADVAAENWYTCVAELDGQKLKLKVYPKGGTEPDDWMVSIDVPAGYILTENHDYSLMIRVSQSSDIQSSIWVDNIRISDVQTGDDNPGDDNTGDDDYDDGLTDPEYEYYHEDFEDFTEGDVAQQDMGIACTYLPEGTTVQTVGGNKVLQMNLDSRYDHMKFFVPTENKEVLYDFWYDHDFYSYGGILTDLHYEMDGSNYYFEFNPTLTQTCFSVGPTQLKKYTGLSMSSQNWYHVRSRIQDGSMYVKLWQGDTEPAAWTYSCSLADYQISANAQDMVGIGFSQPSGSNTVYFDNVRINTWDDLDIPTCTVAVSSADETMGTVLGGGTYLTGAQAKVEAKANSNYAFVNWTNGDGDVVSTNAEYTFTAADGLVLIANFERLVPTIRSFMAEGMTLPAQIDKTNKTVTVTFASDTDLTQVRPYFYLENWEESDEDPKPYEIMDLSNGSVRIGDWTVIATKKSLMTQFYVNPVTGNDVNDGTTRAKAVKTLERAQELVRGITSWTGDVIVNLAAGEYLQTSTLNFTSADSAENGCAVIWRGNGDVTITSGRHLTGWQPIELEGKSGVWYIDATDMPYSRDLYVDGTKAIIARSSEADTVPFMGFDTVDRADMVLDRSYGYRVTGNMADMYSWRNADDIEFVYEVGWTYRIVPVTGVEKDGDGTKVTMMTKPFQDSLGNAAGIHEPNYVQNAYELLDEAGEWYFDRDAARIYYIPGADADPNELDIIMPTLDKLVEINGTGADPVEGLAFVNLNFEYTSFLRPHLMGQAEIQANFIVRQDMIQPFGADRSLKTPGGVTANYAHGMRVAGCTFSQMSAGGFDFELGCVGCTITENTFTQLGASAIQIGGVSSRDAQPLSNYAYIDGVLRDDLDPDPDRITGEILVMSNLIHDIGVEYKGSIGVFVGCTHDVTVAHNTLTRLPYSGISAGWNWGAWDQGGLASSSYANCHKYDTPSVQARYVIENNDISYVMQRLTDGGSIYTLSLMPGSIIRGNYMHDTAYLVSGIYNDEGSGGFADMSENIVANSHSHSFNFNTWGGVFQKRYQETLAVMHDNYWNTGDMRDPLYAEIVNRAGLLPWKDYGGSSDQEAADAVEALIAAIGTVTLDSEEAIEDAEAAYEALTDAQKALVDNYSTLTDARAEYNRLKAEADQAAADQEAADAVDALIEAIGEVTVQDKVAIEAARDAYEKLTAAQKELVQNLAILEAAEAALEALQKPVRPSLPVHPPVSAPSKPAVTVKLPFTDVPASAWYYDEVKMAWEAGLIDGMTATTYEPESTLTVAQAIKLAAALHQLEKLGKVTLTNGTDDWYSTYVTYAIANGIIEEAYADYTWAQMNAPATRAEFVHIFHGAKEAYAAMNTVADNAIPDVKVGDKYADEIYTFYRAGILTGNDAAGTFAPASSIKRSEVAAILIRMFDKDARQTVTLN